MAFKNVAAWRESNPLGTWKDDNGHPRSDLCVVMGISDTTLGRVLRGEQMLQYDQRQALLGRNDPDIKAMLEQYDQWWAQRPEGGK
uniref:Uncharacterized protein n=1 Tax=viral metagenome TaxID=1070528 RepID=A0A6H1ZDL3_9ZZZZ